MDDAGHRARHRAAKEYSKTDYKGLDDTKPLPELPQEVNHPEKHGTTGFIEPNYRPIGGQETDLPGSIAGKVNLQGAYTASGPHKDDAEAARLGMQPHLQIMCGPMLRYDTVHNGVWHGFAMLVCSDGGSDYTEKPTLRWSARRDLTHQMQNTSLNGHDSPLAGEIQGLAIYKFAALHGGNSFWRFKLEIPLQDTEIVIDYSINRAATNSFHVPAKRQNMRWIGHSCNGFSAGVKTEEFNGPNPLWDDLLSRHADTPFHAVVGGGDQIYCDPIVREPELSEWLQSVDVPWKVSHPLTKEMSFALHRFFFNHYCSWFRSGSFAKAIASIPMINMLDDHDLIDGFGTYDDKLQSSPVFSGIGAAGYFWFLLFQMFIVDEVDGTLPTTEHTNKSIFFGGEGAWIPNPAHHFISYLGPNQYILLLDCRAERKKNQICSQYSYDRMFEVIRQLPPEVDHVTVLLGVPIAYPRMVFAEKLLSSSFSPAKLAAKIGIGSQVNKFNRDAELLDDLNDHWCADGHKQERNAFVQACAKSAKENRVRISFLSGDVHAGAVGYFYDKEKTEPVKDPKYMLNIISSAIVNTPPPAAMISLLNKLGGKTHSTLHHAGIDESMIPLFERDTDGSKLRNQYIIGKRNYVIVNYQEDGRDLQWDLRVEIKQGEGKTASYVVNAPAVQY